MLVHSDPHKVFLNNLKDLVDLFILSNFDQLLAEVIGELIDHEHCEVFIQDIQ